jgi:CheY-like chemotaxis protein
MQTSALNALDSRLNKPIRLRILVADDDPSSRLYLSETLVRLGNQVDGCADGLAAVEQACRQHYDLLLLDCRMPGAGALEVLQALRGDPQAQSHHAPAVATSAQVDGELRQQLLSAGFREVMAKPCHLESLRLMTARIGSALTTPLLDDESALSASGDAAVLSALRGLLHEELVVLYQDLDRLLQHPQDLYERLHRLRSSCGFCGAHALASQSIALQNELRHGLAAIQQILPAFRQVLLETLDALAPSAT